MEKTNRIKILNMMKRPMYKAGGKTLKAVPKNKEKIIMYLPKKVRNKMGFKKDGGKIK